MTATAEPSLKAKIDFLCDPRSHRGAAGAVDVTETSKSFVFFVEDRVYKLKKPQRGAFLDLRTLDGREENVSLEIRLNRRLSPDVYLGARALRQGADGTLSLTGDGRAVDWLVEMRRLPEDRTVESLIRVDRLNRGDVDRIVDTLGAFYRGLPAEDVSADRLIAQYDREQTKTARALTDPAFGLDPGQVQTALAGFDGLFDTVRPLLRARSDRQEIVEGHGDLRPEHVFLTRPVTIIDCLEFDRLLRIIDPYEEIVFLGLECALLGADWVFPALCNGLYRALGRTARPEVLAFYWRYRALLKARLAILHLSAPKVRKPDKWRPLARRCIALSQEAEVRTRRPEGR